MLHRSGPGTAVLPQDPAGSGEIGPSSPALGGSSGELRVISDSYVQIQHLRIQMGERIRAVLQGRDQPGSESDTAVSGAADILKQIGSGRTDGPVPLLGRMYRTLYQQERTLVPELESQLALHPAWPWLGRVKGVGATLAGRLLARLEVGRAATPSSFWAYCGLATVPGVAYRCDECGIELAFPDRYRVSGRHMSLGGRRRCPGQLKRVEGEDGAVRVAQPRMAGGESASYDSTAKKVCYLIGVSFLKTRSPYAGVYRAARAELDRDRGSWPAQRRHLTALRRMEKLFLSHLWLVWREAVGLPVAVPYVHATSPGASYVGPWEMVGAAARCAS